MSKRVIGIKYETYSAIQDRETTAFSAVELPMLIRESKNITPVTRPTERSGIALRGLTFVFGFTLEIVLGDRQEWETLYC